MLGVWFEGGRVQVRRDLPTPDGGGEVPVQILVAGVCTTDLALRGGYLGFRGVPGHEFVGVAAAGRYRGQRVVGEINVACGHCATCRQGLPRHCPRRSVLGIQGRSGAFADLVSLPEQNLHPVPDGVATAAAVFTEPLAAAFEILEQVTLPPRSRVLVAGDGKLGLLCAHVLARAGQDVVVAGRHPERRALLPAGVAFETGLVESPPPRERAYDLAVEATGHPDNLARLARLVRPRGRIVLKTTRESPATLDLAPLVIDEIQVIGSRCGPFAPALRALAERAIPVEALVHARRPLDQAEEALDAAARPGALKVLLDVRAAAECLTSSRAAPRS